MNGSPDSTPTVAAGSIPLSEAAIAWSWWQRLGFRFLLLSYVLYAFPGPLGSLLQTIAGGLGWVAEHLGQPWLGDRPFTWPGKWALELGKVGDGWKAATSWLDQHDLAPYEVIHQMTGSGDTGHDIAKLLVVVVSAALLTAVWSLLQRRPVGYPRLGRWLHLVVRFDLAFTMLGYGLAKFYGGQFGELSLDRLTQEIGNTWPMSMVGTFMQAFKPYELFGGGGEVLGGLLLFHRRTALLGTCVSIAVMTNVCAINWLCGVPVKLFSAYLLLCAVFLLAPYRHSLWALFVRNRPTQPVGLTLPAPRWLRWPLRFVGFGWVLGTLLLIHVSSTQPQPWMQGREKSELYGLWSVEKMLLNGQDVPITDAKRWRFLAIDRGKAAWVREATGQRHNFEFAWDPATGSAQVKPLGANAAAVPWTCEQGNKVVQVDPPLVLRNEERGRKVDGQRRTLVFKGLWHDQQLELHTVEKRFRLQTGFRLRQELPDFW